MLRLAAASLLGVLTVGGEEEAGAERPHDRMRRRSTRRNRKQRNKRRKNKNNGGGGGDDDRSEPAPCRSNGDLCDQDSECCSNNCFNFVCANRVTQCTQASATRQCVPPAKGCAGGACCYGAAACGDTCCQPPANPCNPQGDCCAPNCAGRQCGPDGCGAGGACGTCPTNATCNETTGQCQSSCTPRCQGKQCGPDGCGGSCGSCPPDFTCNETTGQCGNCNDCDPSIETCCSGQCVILAGDDNNCGACGHQCIPPTVCSSSICCMLHPGSQCSATVPCCGAANCQNGTCCVQSGQGCNQNPTICCSGRCTSFGTCA